MLRTIWIASLYVRAFMRRFMPTNIALDKLRTRRGLKWGVPAMLLAGVYFYLAAVMNVLVDGGSSKWLYVVMLVCIWNAFKFLVFGPISLVTLMRVRLSERRAAGRAQQHFVTA
ncbi:MAG: sulfate permease [Microbacterium sp. 69-10]|uniref:sulfate permease n=1 Tax=Microbacterium sp. 69-10 TaxID=1895783 RepID=UPI0009625182|nr:sulfate permease [Microbacterium sp. 69-10]OJU39333.1 MAG: sulfate permease [Microbacterium sp. 69-10]